MDLSSTNPDGQLPEDAPVPVEQPDPVPGQTPDPIEDPTNPKKPGLLKSIGKGIAEIATSPIQDVKSVLKGGIDIGRDTFRTATELGAGLLHVTGLGKVIGGENWKQMYEEGGSKAFGDVAAEPFDGLKNAIFGKTPPSAAQQFVEGTAAFVGSMMLAAEVKVGGTAIKALPFVARGAAEATLASTVSIDPYGKQLAELAADTSIPGISALGSLLSVHEDTGPIAARVKRSLAAVIPGVAIDGVIAGAGFLRAAAKAKAATTPAEHAAATAEMAQHAETLKNIDAGTHIPDEPIVVKPTPDGQYTLEVNAPVAEKMGLTHEAPILPEGATAHPDLTTPIRAEAEQAALPINAALKARFDGSVTATAEDVGAIKELASKIEAASPEEAAALVTDARFNYGYMDAPARTESLLKALGEHLGPAFDKAQGRGGVPWSETLERAREFAGMVPRDELPGLLKNAATTIKNSDVIVAHFDAQLKAYTEDAVKWSRLADRDPNNPVVLGELRNAMQKSIDVAVDAAGTNSGLGRGLAFLRSPGRGSALADVKFKGEAGAVSADAAKAAAGEPPAVQSILQQMKPEDLTNLGRLFQIANDKKALLETLVKEVLPPAGKEPATVKGAVIETYYNLMLSNPATWKAVFVSNSVINVLEDGVRALAGAFSRDPEMIRQSADLLMGRLMFLKQSLIGMKNAAIAGHPIIDGSPVYTGVPGAAGEVIRSLGSRPIAMADEFWRVNSNLSYVYMKAMPAARLAADAAGLVGKARDSYIDEWVQGAIKASRGPTGASRLGEARQFAALPTFTSPLEPGSFGSDLQALVAKHEWLTPMLPFVRVSVNSLMYTFEKGTPLGLFSENVRATLARGGPEAAILRTRMAVGTMVWSTAALLAFQDQITGNGPNNPQLRQVWLKTHQPYSFQTDSGWVSYRRLEPFATPLSVMADIAQIKRDNAGDLELQSDADKTYYGLVAATLSALTNKSYLTGIVQTMNAIGSRDGGAVKAFMDRQMSLLVPGELAAFDQDPYARQTLGKYDAVVNRTPGWSRVLPAKFDVFGDPITLQPSRSSRALDAFPSQTIPADHMAEDEMLRLNRALTPPPKVVRFGGRSVNLEDPRYRNVNGGTETPYERMMRATRQMDLRGRVNTLINSEEYQRAGEGTIVSPGGLKLQKLQVLVNEVQHRAEQEMLHEYPDLAFELKALRRARIASQKSDAKGESILDRIQ